MGSEKEFIEKGIDIAKTLPQAKERYENSEMCGFSWGELRFLLKEIYAQFSPQVGTTPIKYPENKEGYKVGIDMAAGWNMAIDEMKRLNG